MDPEVILLDEPTAGMSIEEIPTILNLVEGPLIAYGDSQQIMNNPQVQAAYLGIAYEE